MPVLHTAGIPLLEIKGTKNLLLPAQLYTFFPAAAPSTSLTVQEHKDLVSVPVQSLSLQDEGCFKW